jgi:hypothetical protein
MATVSVSNRSIVAVLFLVGGALQILGAIVGLVNAGNAGGFYLLSNLAIGAGFAVMIAWFAGSTVARIAYFVAALGWLLLALTSLLNLGFVSQVAVLIAIVGTVWAGIIVMMKRPFAGEADILYFVGFMVGALNLLLSQNGNVPRFVVAVVVVFFGALLVLGSVFLLRGRLRRTA